MCWTETGSDVSAQGEAYFHDQDSHLLTPLNTSLAPRDRCTAVSALNSISARSDARNRTLSAMNSGKEAASSPHRPQVPSQFSRPPVPSNPSRQSPQQLAAAQSSTYQGPYPAAGSESSNSDEHSDEYPPHSDAYAPPRGTRKPVLYFYRGPQADVSDATELVVTISVEQTQSITVVYPRGDLCTSESGLGEDPTLSVQTDRATMEPDKVLSATWVVEVDSKTSARDGHCNVQLRQRDGSLCSRPYPYLFWETSHSFGPLLPGQEGVVTIGVRDLDMYFEQLFECLGYNPREAADFFTYWISTMSSYRYISCCIKNAQGVLVTVPEIPTLRKLIVWTGHAALNSATKLWGPQQHSVECHGESLSLSGRPLCGLYAIEWGASHTSDNCSQVMRNLGHY